MATSPSENSVLVSASKSKVLSLSGDLTGDFVGDLVGDLFGGCWCDDAAASGVPVGRRPAGAWVGITLSPLTSSAGLYTDSVSRERSRQQGEGRSCLLWGSVSQKAGNFCCSWMFPDNLDSYRGRAKVVAPSSDIFMGDPPR